MGKGREDSDALIQISPDFLARMEEQVNTLLLDITEESFRIARSRGLKDGVAAVNCYPILLQVIGMMIEKQHVSMCKAAVLSLDMSKGPGV